MKGWQKTESISLESHNQTLDTRAISKEVQQAVERAGCGQLELKERLEKGPKKKDRWTAGYQGLSRIQNGEREKKRRKQLSREIKEERTRGRETPRNQKGDHLALAPGQEAALGSG